MSNVWENAVITNKGAALQAKLLAGASIPITAVKAGSGTVPLVNLRQQTAVTDIKQTASIRGISSEDYTATIQIYMDNSAIETAYDLYQIGFYATDPGEGEVLYALAQATTGIHIPSKTDMTGFSIVLNFSFTLSNDLEISVTIDQAGMATKADLETKMDKENPECTGSFSNGRISTYDIGSHSFGFGDAVAASNQFSTAFGHHVLSTGYCSHGRGQFAKSTGQFSFSDGYELTANANQHVFGHYNDNALAEAGNSQGTTGTLFCIGNGTSSAKSNAMRVTGEGKVIGKQAYASSGADYAELREWADGNTDNEDRRGYFVTLDGDKIRIAEPGEFIEGIISGNPCVIGNHDECWAEKFVRDEFNCFIYDTKEVEVQDPTPDNPGRTKKETAKVYRLNPEYDPSKTYTEREKRHEWDFVGMLGHLPVRDDGSCQSGKYCVVGHGGIATASEKGYRVVKRITENVVEIVFSIYANF